jgi:CubicO group peptidase (beta-lactamase class C family)
VEATAKELLVPGAMVLLRTPQGNFAFGYGTTELGVTTPPRADTYFRIASNTKTMTAAVIVLLAQDGKLRFDDPVAKYEPGVPKGDEITIGELLKMRSGLPSYTDAPELTVRAGHGIRLLQHELRAARSHRRANRRQAFGPGLSGSFVRTARHDAHIAPCAYVERDP